MADTFILLDDVQYPKGAGARNWTNRHLILENGKQRWATAPISRNFTGFKNVNEIRFAQDDNWKRSYLDQISNSYYKAKHFSETFDFLQFSLAYETEFLSELNIHLINSVLRILKISDQTLRTSSALKKDGKSNHLLCSLIKSVGGDSYLCGAGSSEYLDAKIFESNNIEITYQNYRTIEYPQFNTNKFFAGLSIIDALMNCGVNKTRDLVFGVENV